MQNPLRRTGVRILFAATIAGLVALGAGCASAPQPSDYAQQQPKLDFRAYFNGPVSAQGLFTDRSGRVVWINDQYRRYLPALGFAREADFVGQPVASVVENTLMNQVLESGKPILIDLLSNRAGTFVVSRLPLRDAQGQVIGALGVVLFEQPQTNLQPLLAKFALLQRELDEVDIPGEISGRAKHFYCFFQSCDGYHL